MGELLSLCRGVAFPHVIGKREKGFPGGQHLGHDLLATDRKAVFCFTAKGHVQHRTAFGFIDASTSKLKVPLPSPIRRLGHLFQGRPRRDINALLGKVKPPSSRSA